MPKKSEIVQTCGKKTCLLHEREKARQKLLTCIGGIPEAFFGSIGIAISEIEIVVLNTCMISDHASKTEQTFNKCLVGNQSCSESQPGRYFLREGKHLQVGLLSLQLVCLHVAIQGFVTRGVSEPKPGTQDSSHGCSAASSELCTELSRSEAGHPAGELEELAACLPACFGTLAVANLPPNCPQLNTKGLLVEREDDTLPDRDRECAVRTQRKGDTLADAAKGMRCPHRTVPPLLEHGIRMSHHGHIRFLKAGCLPRQALVLAIWGRLVAFDHEIPLDPACKTFWHDPSQHSDGEDSPLGEELFGCSKALPISGENLWPRMRRGYFGLMIRRVINAMYDPRLVDDSGQAAALVGHGRLRESTAYGAGLKRARGAALMCCLIWVALLRWFGTGLN